MATHKTQQSLTRLACLKQQRADELRADLIRLRDLQRDAERVLQVARDAEAGFIDLMRSAEQQAGMRADTMIQHRAYLAHLAAGVARSRDNVRRVGEQFDEARDALERARREVKVLEKLFERRALVLHATAQRKDYAMADAQQLAMQVREGAARE